MVTQFTVAGNTINQYLVIWAFGGNSSLDGLTISKIIIKQTPPPTPPFSITASQSSILCGNATAISFTANNSNNTAGITSYTWDLGGTNNGWQYQGNPAPAIITTNGTTPAINLTSTCGAKANNVSVTVNVGVSSYGPYTATITQSVPTPAIIEATGKTLLYSNTGNTYTVPNAPCSASIAWYVNQSGVTGGTVGYSTNGNILTLNNPLPGICGSVSLTAVMTTAFGTNGSGASVPISNSAA